MSPPGHDFYATVAQVIPLLLITAALEGRRLYAEGVETLNPLELFIAVGGEIGAFAGLTGSGSRTTAAVAALGLGMTGSAVLAPIAHRVVSADRPRWSERPGRVLTAVIGLMPMVAALIYGIAVTTT